MKDKIVIANCGGFWGDDPTAAKRQVEGGPIDYLVMDYLAEVTMAILQKQKLKDPTRGYAADFLVQLRDVLATCVEKGITIIANAGGVNPEGCRDAVMALAEELGLADGVRVGVVTGDDIFGDIDELIAGGEQLEHMETGRPLSDARDRVLSANVYLGAAPVAEALRMGANIVISGRVTDTGVTLAPMIHEFGWAADDWDRLASGIVAGHIIECGTQCTGGNFTDWQLVPDQAHIGYPVIEVASDGTFTVTKHPGTGGLVSVHTVSEQLVYEMGAPEYLAPDCVARFDSITLEQETENRVRVSGVCGEPAPEKLKVSLSVEQGFRAFGRLMISGPDAIKKAEHVAEVFWTSAGGRDHYADTLTQMIGHDSCHPSVTGGAPGEIMLQVAARDDDRSKLAGDFAPQLVPKVLSTVPGITYLSDQGRPRPSGVVGYWPALIAREKVRVHVEVGGERVEVPDGHGRYEGITAFLPQVPPRTVAPGGNTVRLPLSKLCLARSGDKGDTANIGVIARSPDIYHWMVETLTEAFIKEHFGTICKGGVDRFEVPNLLALNFLLHQSLGGGGTLSLLVDAQGKTYSQFLLSKEVEVDEVLWASISK